MLGTSNSLSEFRQSRLQGCPIARQPIAWNAGARCPLATAWDSRPQIPSSGRSTADAIGGAEGDASRQKLKLLLVATRQHLASPDVRNLVSTLQAEETGFEISLEVADPATHPELLELHRLVATPALVKLEPPPKQVFEIGRAHV